MSLLTFTTHVFTDAAAGVTSEEVFVTLSYLNVMRGVVSVAPMVLTDLVKVHEMAASRNTATPHALTLLNSSTRTMIF